ncbi:MULTISPECIES: DUF6323 family protein [Bacillus subtilis group]|uniref:Uncharacterized protein n=2 Tax=Bacillus subtilis TaxID=1423 RepID=A0A0D1IQW9_BACIU|nr:MULTISPECIES: DUF6323 family protein [Bacillus subtilis group]AMA51571.1 hypothetical protein AN935_04555 [Bacillus inaquosorum]KIU11773.1 hypothetical protein SC09_Contig19orf00001 [Bacillus subtilis]MBT2190070.1 hypothetical protein [Bacillus inaquosorum]MBT3116823.1 hypothetical protein [Bacillus inaquosorum]MBT3124589.1 hypothetical protein [Bacillus inaquosorum]
MNLSRIFNEIQLSPQSKTMVDLLKLNEKTKEYGLVLKPNDVKNLVVSRNKVLHDHARVELGIEVLKELIEVFSTSPYMDQDNYVETLNELQEIFYYLRNETEDKIGDVKLINQMMDYFNGPCAGSIELLRSKMEELADNFRRDMMRRESLFEGEE